MGSDWKSYILDDLVLIEHGFAFKGSGFRDEPTSDVLLTPGNFAIGGGFKCDKLKYFDGDVPKEYVLNSGDLLVTMTDLSKQADTLGYPAIVPDTPEVRYLHNQRLGLVKIKPNAPLIKRYLFYLLCSDEYRHEVIAGATGTTVKHTAPKRIGTFRFFLPDVAEQKAIAHILGTLDDKIELNRKMNETLETMARTIFKSWFVDFDPVHAKAQGKQPVGMDAETAALFPDSFVDSELGKIPKGWKVVSIARAADINYGKNLAKKLWLDAGIPVYGAAGVVGFYSEIMFHEPVVLVTSRGSGSGTVHETIGPSYVTNNSFSVVPRETWIGRHFIKHSLFNADILSLVSGSAQPQLTITNFEYLKILFPTRKILESFNPVADSLWQRAKHNLSENETLSKLRDTLLPKLLSGEIRVKDAEKIVEGAA